MNEEFWIKKWEENEIRFHQSTYHRALIEFGGKFALGSTVLVPLSGKTLDMIHLMKMGHKVVGVELSPIACRDFFLENKIEFTELAEGEFIHFKSENVSLWCGDFFKLPDHVWREINGVYDRAALVALPQDLREKYAADFCHRSQMGLEILLIAFDYPQASLKGPPFSVPESEIRKIYPGLEVGRLREYKEFVREHEVKETVFWIKKIG